LPARRSSLLYNCSQPPSTRPEPLRPTGGSRGAPAERSTPIEAPSLLECLGPTPEGGSARSAGIDEGRHAVRAHLQAHPRDGKRDDLAAQPCELGLDGGLGAGLDQKHDAAASPRPADLGGEGAAFLG